MAPPRKYVRAPDLTPLQVVDLRQRWADGYRGNALAERYGVDPRYLSRIASGELRKDITTDLPRWLPLCMSHEEYLLWQTKIGSNFSTGTPRPCDDCSLGFASEMRQLGLCNGTPGLIADDEEAA